MSDFPETRETLLLRVRDPSDREAWAEFVSIYRPVIYRIGRRRGLQDADAQDLTQRVLLSVSRTLADWEHDESRGRFRTWLSRVARNAVIDSFRRLRPDTGRGGSSVVANLQSIEQQEIGEEELETEYRRQLFRRAALTIRPDFEEESWAAFWMTTVEGRSAEEVAASIGRSCGAVYSAKARVMRRLREEVQSQSQQDDPDR